MGQITLYLDDETLKKVRSRAKAAGVSQSRWVADLITRGESASEWPRAVAELAGAWPDAPLADELRGKARDTRREPL